MKPYYEFLQSKTITHDASGFDVPVEKLNPMLFDWQKVLVHWALKKGRGALFEDCGLGKTPQQLEWAQKIVERENKPVLIFTPLAVSHQTVMEGEKFGIECKRSSDGKVNSKIVVTNYERLHYFNPADFVGVVCDESSILKNFDGKRKKDITQFIKKFRYRLLCTATASPNDYIELGTSSEALGAMGYIDMLGRFFKNNQSNCALKSQYRQSGDRMPQWRFKKHAEQDLWRWVCSWARAIRKPSDIGYGDEGFILPELIIRETVIQCSSPMPGKLFVEPAIGLREQRAERRMTIRERCEEAASRVNGKPIVLWCHLNDEADLLEQIIPGSKQVAGRHSDEKKEETFLAFGKGELKTLITKPKIGCFGLNWQHCSDTTFFPSHSFEQFYQSTRRFWRFGQKNPVNVNIITTEGEFAVLKNLQRKAKAADKMFSNRVKYMGSSLSIEQTDGHKQIEDIPKWLQQIRN